MQGPHIQGHGKEADFPRFLHISRFGIAPFLHYISSRSDFGFEFAEIFVIEKTTRRVGESPTRRIEELLWWVGEPLLEFFLNLS
jgi:hypothetical protein